MRQASSVKFLLFHDSLTHAWAKTTLAFFFGKFANYVKTLKSKITQHTNYEPANHGKKCRAKSKNIYICVSVILSTENLRPKVVRFVLELPFIKK